jgi:hypothetical protein
MDLDIPYKDKDQARQADPFASRCHIPNRPIPLPYISRRPRRRIFDPHPAVMPGTLYSYVCARDRVVIGADPCGRVYSELLGQCGC